MSRGGGGGGSFLERAFWKVASASLAIIAVGMLMIAITKDPAGVGRLYGTAAVVGGQSGGMFVGSVPQLFTSFTEGQDLVKPALVKKTDKPKKAAPAADEN